MFCVMCYSLTHLKHSRSSTYLSIPKNEIDSKLGVLPLVNWLKIGRKLFCIIVRFVVSKQGFRSAVLLCLCSVIAK